MPRSSAVLERLPQRMNWSAPFDRGNGNVRRGRGIAHRLQGVDLAHHLGRYRQRRAPTAASRFTCGTVDMGQGSDTAMAQIVAEVLEHSQPKIDQASCIPTPM